MLGLRRVSRHEPGPFKEFEVQPHLCYMYPAFPGERNESRGHMMGVMLLKAGPVGEYESSLCSVRKGSRRESA